MAVTIPHPSRRTLTRRTTGAPTPEGEDAVYVEVYEKLYEAAHLVSRASRQLRATPRRQDGFALQLVVDEIHEHIRRLPESAVSRPPARSRRFRHNPSDR